MHNFYVHWETTKFRRLALVQYLPHCDGLELNVQYLQGMPVFKIYESPL